MPPNDVKTLNSTYYPALLDALNVGSPIAEDDTLLHDARVETAVFWQLLRDEVDIVRGTKGSGKSALYRLCTNYLDQVLLDTRKTVVLKGVEATGDPIFNRFKEQFDQLTEVDFDNFWRIYFMSLVTSQFLANRQFRSHLAQSAAAIKKFRKLAQDNGFPTLDKKISLVTVIAWALAKLPKVRNVKLGMPGLHTEVDLESGVHAEPTVPVFVSELTASLETILEGADLRLWLMLDRLDEVFPRRSETERRALRGLLRTTMSFRNKRTRMKIFLRDDIFDSITETPEGFTALTHVLGRSSDTLTWNKDQIAHLIVKRVFNNSLLRDFFTIDIEKLDKDPEYRVSSFYKVFPLKLRRGKNQSNVLDWIYRHCEDANGVVTPRDVIDLVRFAKGHQQDLYLSNPEPMASLLSSASIIYGHKRMSEHKKETYLKAEFAHFWKYIEKFESGKAEHDEASIQELLGRDWRAKAKDLRAIGFLKYNPRSLSYSIPFLYRPCLTIRQGRRKGGM